MGTFIIRRLIWAVAIIYVAMTLTFLLTYVIPADPAGQVAGPLATELEVENIRRTLGLNDPLHVQYGRYFLNVLKGDLGRSWMFRRRARRALWFMVTEPLRTRSMEALTRDRSLPPSVPSTIPLHRR